MVKLMPSERQAISRRLATFRSISRPSTLTRITLPTCMPHPRAISAANDTSGGPA